MDDRARLYTERERERERARERERERQTRGRRHYREGQRSDDGEGEHRGEVLGGDVVVYCLHCSAS